MVTLEKESFYWCFILVLGIGETSLSVSAPSRIWWYGFALLAFKYVPEPPMRRREPLTGMLIDKLFKP